MSEPMYHPTSDRLEAFVEGVLEKAESVVIESHVLGCSRCQGEVDEVRTLFTSLAALPRFAPAAGFANRIMTQVKLPDPWYARAGSWIHGFMPKSRRGWAFAGGVFAVPLVSFAAVLGWLLSKPYVTGEGLLAFAIQQVSLGITATLSEAGSVMLHSGFALLLARGLEVLADAGLRGAGLAVTLFASLTALSAWILYQNLFRNPSRSSNYVSYSF